MLAAPHATNAPARVASPRQSSDRTFRAGSPRAALEAVRAAFGDDALIVDTRELVISGARVVEITARQGAADPAGSRPVPNPAASPFALAPPRPAPGDGGVVRLEEQLEAAGTAAHIAKRVAERVERESRAQHPRAKQPTQHLAHVFEEIVDVATPPWQPIEGKQRVVALVGPTGVGKTTSIGKIAARAVLEHGARVALITLDTWRIGAVDHIRRYGEIMGVPTFVANDVASLQHAMKQASAADLVLIDTAGRSPAEVESFEAQLALLRSVDGIEIHIAVTAGASVRQLRAVRERYAQTPGLFTLVTKVDEADGPGGLLNVAAILGRAVSAFTDGQRVPEDIHALDLADLAVQVMTP